MNSQDLVQYALPAALIIGFLVFKQLGQISSAKAKELVKNGAALLDVRSPAEFGSGHLPGAKNMPVQELGAHVKKLGAKDQPIVVYCASGTRSAMARSMLKAQGFTQVFNLGSMGRW
jgi:rhodanese-related sulfurtransferase